jgi:Ceramidase
MSISNRRLGSILGVVSLVMICFVAVPPVAQDPRYHEFADTRGFHSVPNFWNVISNVAFFLVALYGTKNLRLRLAFVEPWERIAYGVLLAGTAAVGAGSICYHLQPNDARLVWDRLPMTVVFMSLLASTVGERVSMKAGRALLLPMILLGLGSVLYWRSSGDLRPYCAVQFGSMLAMPFILARFPSRYSAAGRVWGTVLLYALAKVVELLDHEIASWIAMGGHPWKHLIAAGAVALYVSAIGRRRPQEIAPMALGGGGCRLATSEPKRLSAR